MTDPEVPDGLTYALRGVGRHTVGPAGPDGSRWWVRADDGTRELVTAVPSGAPGGSAEVRRRVGAVARLRHEHIADLGPVLRLPGDAVAVLQQHVGGYDLDTVRAARGPWSPGEVVTVLVPLAGAVAALHDAGLSYEVAARDVVLTPDGRAVLVGLVGTGGILRPVAGEVPGVSRSGSDHPSSDPDAAVAGDVQALGRLGLELLGQPGSGSGHPRIARLVSEPPGTESPQAAARRAQVWQVLSMAARVTIEDRSQAIRLASDLYRACPAEPVEQPESAVLAGLALRRPAVGTSGRDRGRHRRTARPAHRRLQVGAVSLAVALCGLTVAATVTGTATERGETAGTEVADVDAVDAVDVSLGSADTAVDPVDAAVELTRARAEALVTGDLAALRAVTVPGSPAARGDEAAARDAAVSGLVGGALDVRIALAEELPSIEASGGSDENGLCLGCVRVHLRSAVTAAPAGELDAAREVSPRPGRVDRQDPEGATAGTQARDVVLVLMPTDDGWRVNDVRPYDP